MGTLIGKAYPIGFDSADHTYVECGTGNVGWGCWGGKNGGREIVRGTGSTKQADAIAGSDERGGITCYAINGVCHQAANRILWPARVLVTAAKGYWLSTSLYTTYGLENKNWFDFCEAPFNQHNDISGDLPECLDKDKLSSSVSLSKRHSALVKSEIMEHQSFAETAMKLHLQARKLSVDDQAGHTAYQLEHFDYQSRFRLGSTTYDRVGNKLHDIRSNIEKKRFKIEKLYAEKEIDIKEFAEMFNKLTVSFQDDMAETLKPEHYRAYFSLEQTQRVILLDPTIIDKINATSAR